MGKVKLTYTIETTVKVETEDYALSYNQVVEAVESEIKKHLPLDCDNYEWDWCDYPKIKGIHPVPLPEHWIRIKDNNIIATNYNIVINKSFPVHLIAKIEKPWLEEIDDETKDLILKVLSVDFERLPLHIGWFHENFAALKTLEGLQVKGLGEENYAYLVYENELIGVVMPIRKGSQRESDFRFNEE
jgi:hypothetical protein